jgi:hypothetical protein
VRRDVAEDRIDATAAARLYRFEAQLS